jgi:hypothetical protein
LLKPVPDISVIEANAWWATIKEHLMRGSFTEQRAGQLIDLVRAMLVLDPAERPSAPQLFAAHTWLMTAEKRERSEKRE